MVRAEQELGCVAEAWDQDVSSNAVRQRLRSLVGSQGVPTADVDDVVQEIYVVYLAQAHRRPAQVPPVAWLCGIGRHLALAHLRGLYRQRAVQGRLLHDGRWAAGAHGDDAAEDQTQRMQALGRCLSGLSASQRELIEGYYCQGQSTASLAERLGRPVGRVRVQLLRLRRRLQRQLQRA